MKKIYYFSPNCDCELLNNVSCLSEYECKNECSSNDEVFCYAPNEFETAFNDEQISDLGYIRIF